MLLLLLLLLPCVLALDLENLSHAEGVAAMLGFDTIIARYMNDTAHIAFEMDLVLHINLEKSEGVQRAFFEREIKYIAAQGAREAPGAELGARETPGE